MIATFSESLPDEWTEQRLKYAASLRIERVEATSDHTSYLGLENIQSWTGKLLSAENGDSGAEGESEGGTANSFRQDDVLFGKLRPYLAKAFHADREGVCSTELLVLKPRPDMYPRFLLYSFLSPEFVGLVDASTFGAKMPRANWDFIGSMKIPVPNLDVQKRIADYLDRETAHIDALIAEKERMLALLEEKRDALISQTVTRGLDPDAQLKPSGLDWLGDIPALWDLVRIKYLITELTQGSSPQAANTPAEPTEDGVLKLSAVSKGRFVRSENKALRESDGSSQFLSLRKGDVLVTRGNTPDLVADACFVPHDEPNLLIPDLIYRLRIQLDKVLPELLAYFLVTIEGRTQIRREARGSSGSMVKVSQEHVASWVVPIPPTIAEQEQIVHRIMQTELYLRHLSDELQESVRLLKERRSALITAAVTGQIDPKDIAA